MKNKKYLTKSRFAVALQCPTKLYYLDNAKIYANRKVEDETATNCNPWRLSGLARENILRKGAERKK